MPTRYNQPRMITLLVVSDIHYAGAGERARGDFEPRSIPQPLLRWLVRGYRCFFWMRDPFANNALLNCLLAQCGPADLAVANGDFSCDSAFVGVSDDAVRDSVQECLGKLRGRFGTRFRAVLGDHELGKMNIFGGRGGLRWASWQRATAELGLEPFWRLEIGRYVLLGVTSSLLAFPVFAPETLPEERRSWERARADHLTQIASAFSEVQSGQRLLLFCHDPTALPFLGRDEAVRARLDQIEATFIGHLHSPFLLWKSRCLAGMPPIRFLGNTVRRYSVALREARQWRPFQVRLCPALAGIQLLRDGGYLRVRLDEAGPHPVRVERCRLKPA